MTADPLDDAHRQIVKKAQAFFERKAGGPVSLEEAEEWLGSLVEFYKRVMTWQEKQE